MLITADWVLPIDGAPIRNGAVKVHGGTIVEVGLADALAVGASDRNRHDFPGCTIVPGLVNAHTHLVLTCLKDVIGSMPFIEWIRRIPIAYQALSDDDTAASISYGAIKALASGTTVVGDIAYGPESVAIAADLGLAGTFCWEVLGIEPSELAERLYDLEYPSDPGSGCSTRLRCGLSPHSVYTSGPDLLRATHRVAMAQSASFAIHVAESDAETELLLKGTGGLADPAARLAHGFKPSGHSVVTYLESLDVLENAVAIHCTRVLPTDMPRLAQRAAGVVLCPRSNAYLHNGEPPAWRLERAGVALALGTDSMASNSDLDLFEEARALRTMEPRFDARRIIEIMTSGGAHVLGMSTNFGQLSAKCQADLAVFRTPTSEDPYETLLDVGGRSSVEAVLSAGVWRVLNGAPTTGVSVIERASLIASQRAALAIALDTPGL